MASVPCSSSIISDGFRSKSCICTDFFTLHWCTYWHIGFHSNALAFVATIHLHIYVYSLYASIMELNTGMHQFSVYIGLMQYCELLGALIHSCMHGFPEFSLETLFERDPCDVSVSEPH
jgi:hypothetical protein